MKILKMLDKMKRKILLLILLAVWLVRLPAQQHSYPTFDNPPVTPAWAFTPWVWEDSVNTQEAAVRLVTLYKQHHIPVGSIIIDSPWSTAYNNFEWDKNRYPEPEKMIQWMHDNGVRVLMWLTGFINSRSKTCPFKNPKNTTM